MTGNHAQIVIAFQDAKRLKYLFLLGTYENSIGDSGMTFRRMALLALAIVSILLLAEDKVAANPETEAFLKRIKSIGKEGSGSAEAGNAWKQLVRQGPEVIPEILTAMDEADPVAANWMRAAVDAIAEKAIASGTTLDAKQLEGFVRDTRHAGVSRRLAYEWLTRIDPKTPDRLLPGMLNDPGAELRRDAVERALKDAKSQLDLGEKKAATDAYQKLFAAARDRDQVDAIAKQLKDLGVTVDLRAHYGFIDRWMVIGPFDNTEKAGFAKVFAPEQGVTLSASIAGKNGDAVRWTEFKTDDSHCQVDLNKAIGKNMGAAGYAFAEITSPVKQDVEIRAGSNNAVKIFLNGKQLYFREEYHHGYRMDQHVARTTLNDGSNEVLIKVCQNEQTDSWAQNWSFQLRICDSLGGPVPWSLTTKFPPPSPPAK